MAMQLDSMPLSSDHSRADMYIAGAKTRADWYAIRERLLLSDAQAWREAFTEYFKARLQLRYLHPICILQEHGSFRGEGFSIVAIQCSLIEFLESTAQGTNYRYQKRGEPPGDHEYSSSQSVFVAFLRDRAPFSRVFDDASAQDFYFGVRCGLLHEAQTKNGWRIWAEDHFGAIADVENRIVYRNGFQAALLEYIESYGTELQVDTNLQQAFIRKFDNLCAHPADAQPINAQDAAR